MRWGTPLPISNREVKPISADGTAVISGRVGRRQIFIKKPHNWGFFFIFIYMKLFAVYLGGRAKKCNTELHDVVFSYGNKIEDTYNIKLKYKLGTMIELPRACLTADTIAKQADFFSFGTNDLTQTTFGFSRDDIGSFIQNYFDHNILTDDPFKTLDVNGVGLLIKQAVQKGRKIKENLKIGICGEHGGDPRSIEFCHNIGLDYVSCSPFRIPIARLSAAKNCIE